MTALPWEGLPVPDPAPVFGSLIVPNTARAGVTVESRAAVVTFGAAVVVEVGGAWVGGAGVRAGRGVRAPMLVEVGVGVGGSAGFASVTKLNTASSPCAASSPGMRLPVRNSHFAV